jgi:hypothetical protein
MPNADDDVQRVLQAAPGLLRRALTPALRLEAEALANAIADAAQKGATGNLKASVRVERGANDQEFFVRAGGPLTTKPVRNGASATYDYALADEFGTQTEAARPFFFSTARARYGRSNQAIAAAVERVFDGT